MYKRLQDMREHRRSLYHKKSVYIAEHKKGGCVICGYNRCASGLCFHHVNSDEKWSHLKSGHGFAGLGWKRLIAEIDKCVVLCQNCHTEVHEGLHPEYLVKTPKVDLKCSPVQLKLVV